MNDVIKDGTMEQSEQDDTGDWADTGPIRVFGYLEREATNNRTEPGDAHQVVYAQEPVWVLNLRWAESNGEGPGFLRGVLRTKGNGRYVEGTIVIGLKYFDGGGGSLK